MFKFLKEKLKAAVSRISSAIEKEPAEEPKRIEPEEVFTQQEVRHIEKKEAEEIEVPLPPSVEEIIEEKPIIKEEKREERKEERKLLDEEIKLDKAVKEALKHEKPKEAVKEAPKKEQIKEEIAREVIEQARKEEHKPELKKEPVQEEKHGFFSRLKQAITTTRISSEKFDELFWDLEVVMLENNVAFEVIEKIKADLKHALVEKPITRGKVEDAVVESLRESISGLFDDYKAVDFVKEAKGKKPYIISFLGANGSGKTTTIAKMAYMLQQKGLKCVLAAGDTWRSAAIQQLEQHANKLNVPIVKHDYGADPAAVAFDAVEMAKARGIDVVLIDTAGRQHSNANLMDEMKKIVRVAKPDLKIYIGEMIAGNDCIEQIQSFDAAVGIDAVVLSKADIDEKGGTAISVTYVTKKPILFLGMGQEYKDLEMFDKEKILKGLGL